MSTTVVETSPVWVYKLFSENSSSAPEQNQTSQLVCKNKSILTEQQEDTFSTKQSFYTGRGLVNDKFSLNPKNGIISHGPNCYTSLKSRASVRVNSISSECVIQSGERTNKLACLCGLLYKVREPLVAYQEQRGLPRDTEPSFIGLMTTLFQATYHAALTMLTMILNLSPLLEGFLYLCRFLLDKAIEICDTQNSKEKIWKLLVFIGEFIVIMAVVTLMFCLILIPIWHLVSYVLGKAWQLLFTTSSG